MITCHLYVHDCSESDGKYIILLYIYIPITTNLPMRTYTICRLTYVVRQKQTNLICNKEHHTGLCHDTYMTNVEGKKVSPNLVRNLE